MPEFVSKNVQQRWMGAPGSFADLAKHADCICRAANLHAVGCNDDATTSHAEAVENVASEYRSLGTSLRCDAILGCIDDHVNADRSKVVDWLRGVYGDPIEK